MPKKAVLERFVVCLAVLLGWLGTFPGCRHQDSGKGDPAPEIGSRLPNLLEGSRLRNAPVGVPAPQGGWVVYAFAPSCPSCAADFSRIEALAASLPADWVLLSISTGPEGLSSYLEPLHVTVPVLDQVPVEALAEYRIASLPRTYILSSDWELLEVLNGAWQGEVAESLGNRFKVAWKPALEKGQSGGPGKWPDHLCLDARQGPYSRGAKADVFGLRFRCGEGGVWLPEPATT